MMTIEHDDVSPRSKRRKLKPDPLDVSAPSLDGTTKGLYRPISPPFSKRKNPVDAVHSTPTPTWSFDDVSKQTSSEPTIPTVDTESCPRNNQKPGGCLVSSPIQLTHIRDLAPHQNVDAVRLGDILGDPMIKECWNLNFLFDLDFVMQHFDSDVRDTVKVKIVHGFWRKDDERRIALLETVQRYSNIELLSAYIPDPYGTHHSKMLILFRHDDLAQVIIHTANMISRDWGNMTQAVWSSPLLPLLPQAAQSDSPDTDSKATSHPIGSGERFKVDLLKYIGAYERRLADLGRQLVKYDFSDVKAAFIGSAPSRQKPLTSSSARSTSFGWVGLQEILSSIPLTNRTSPGPAPHIVMQVSSIATSTPAWHTHFQSVLARHSSARAVPAPGSSLSLSKASTFFAKREPSNPKSSNKITPKFNVIFPTPNEIRASLDGYDSGHSVHMKLQSAQQQKQLEYLLPLFCHWNQAPTAPDQDTRRKALRGPAAPHIKTYICFTDETHQTIDWAMVTSANLSTQAWGGVANKKDEVWIQSWETGVVVWPALFADSVTGNDSSVMIPLFGKDTPAPEDILVLDEQDNAEEAQSDKKPRTVVGFRMPYDLPLRPYATGDKPWCASSAYKEPDWKGRSWAGYQRR